MIDIERQRRAGDRVGIADAMLARAVDCDEDTLGRIGRRFADEITKRHEAVFVREWRARGEVHHDVLPKAAESDGQREQRSERVSVRVLVGDDEEAIVLLQRVGNRLQVTRLCHRYPLARARR